MAVSPLKSSLSVILVESRGVLTENRINLITLPSWKWRMDGVRKSCRQLVCGIVGWAKLARRLDSRRAQSFSRFLKLHMILWLFQSNDPFVPEDLGDLKVDPE